MWVIQLCYKLRGVENSKEVFGCIDCQTPLSPVDTGGFNLDPPDDPVIEGLGAQAAEWKRKLIEVMLFLDKKCQHLHSGLPIFA